MTTSRLEWEKAAQAITDARSILIVTHVDPDGDAIGSMLGLGHAITAMGKQVQMAVDDGVPGFLSWLPGTDAVYPKLTIGEWDLMIATDASDEERSGKVGAYGREHAKQVINVDHHATNLFFGDIFLVMVEAVSATEVVYRLLDHMNIPVDSRDVALPLLTGLVTDTMGFRVSSVTSETMQIAYKLMETGISLYEVMARTLESKPYSAMQLWARVLPSIELEEAVVSLNIRREDFASIRMKDPSDAGLVSLINQIDEAMIAIIFTELEGDRVKLSMRSKKGYDVSSVAKSLGGGGHTQAAGATVDGTLAEVRERVLRLLKQAVEDGELLLA
ncbi:MAG: bifunctional oligoribonuclease/PAP phosphatase NrnA [Chloroflexota bacterium]